MENEGFKYFAFISYSHKDKKIAKKLQKRLENYHLPSALQKSNPELPKNLSPVFIDESNLVARGSLQSALRDNLDKSKYLIIICSPNSAKSEYVNDEADYFIKNGRADHIIPLIVDGVPHSEYTSLECFPPAILSLPRENEPLGIDIKTHGRNDAFLRVIATMLGLDLDSFISREARERKRKAAIFATVTAAVMIISAVIIWLNIDSAVLGGLVITAATLYTVMRVLLIYSDDLQQKKSIMKLKASDANIDFVFGVNSDSLVLGRNLADIKGNMQVYIDSIISKDHKESIHNFGGIVYLDSNALHASPSFLQSINVQKKKRRVRLFALSDDYDKNLQYAKMMLESLERLQIPPEQTELVLRGTDEWQGMYFQAGESSYGYGNVLSFNEYDMSARLLVHEYPLCNAINFDENGRAVEDVEVLLVGFGLIGQEILRKLIAAGQFEGSRFHATIYDPEDRHRTDTERLRNRITMSQYYPGMFAISDYEITFEAFKYGNEVVRFLRKNASRIKYIVICLEDKKIARDIAINTVNNLQAMGYPQNVYTCDSKGVRCYSKDVQECRMHWLYDSELLYSGEIDRYAIELNSRYGGDWKQLSYFHRMSARASVDYLIPLIRRIMTTTNTLTTEQRENLAKSEHLRWCAFHYTLGYEAMEIEEFIERTKDRLTEIQESGYSSIRTVSNTKTKKHVCLVSWDELDEIAHIENSITHGHRDFKENDRDNIDVIMGLIHPWD